MAVRHSLAPPGDPDFHVFAGPWPGRHPSVYSRFSEDDYLAGKRAQTGLSRAAVRRCLHTLELLGFVREESAKYFSLAPKVLALSHAYTSSSRLPGAAQPLLEKLSGVVQESCSVATLDGDESLYVARAHVSRIITVDLAIGSRLPAYCTSMGRILLAHRPPQRLEGYLRSVELKRYTPRTIVSAARLRKLLSDVRRDGFAMVDQELEEGLRSLAVPITGADGEVVAAMNIGAQAHRMPLEQLQSCFLPHLTAAARNLSLALR